MTQMLLKRELEKYFPFGCSAKLDAPSASESPIQCAHCTCAMCLCNTRGKCCSLSFSNNCIHSKANQKKENWHIRTIIKRKTQQRKSIVSHGAKTGRGSGSRIAPLGVSCYNQLNIQMLPIPRFKKELNCLFPEHQLLCRNIITIQTVKQPMNGLQGWDISWRNLIGVLLFLGNRYQGSARF